MIRVGDYRSALADVECDTLIADPPYGARTHRGHDGATRRVNGAVRASGRPDPPAERRTLAYAPWTPEDAREFVAFWAPRTRGWMGVFSCSDLDGHYRDAMAAAGRYTFAPVPCVVRGMTVRLSGDGPSSWCVWLNLSRPKSRAFCGGWTRPGAYVVSSRGPRRYIGGKSLELMEAIVGDYSREGDLVCDPTAGWGTTGVAALRLGRRFVGAELDTRVALGAIDRLRTALPGS